MVISQPAVGRHKPSSAPLRLKQRRFQPTSMKYHCRFQPMISSAKYAADDDGRHAMRLLLLSPFGQFNCKSDYLDSITYAMSCFVASCSPRRKQRNHWRARKHIDAVNGEISPPRRRRFQIQTLKASLKLTTSTATLYAPASSVNGCLGERFSKYRSLGLIC